MYRGASGKVLRVESGTDLVTVRVSSIALIRSLRRQGADRPVPARRRDITVLQGRVTVVAEGDDILIFIPMAGG